MLVYLCVCDVILMRPCCVCRCGSRGEPNVTRVYACLSVGVYVVSAAPLYSRIHVTYSYVFVFCYVSKSFLFCFVLYNSFSSSSSTATRLSGGIDVTEPRPPTTPSSCQSLKSGQEGRSSVTLVRGLPRSHLRVSGRGGRWHLGSTCLFILFLAGERRITSQNTSSTGGIHGRKKPATSSGNCPTDNANGLPSPRSRQKSFLGFKFKKDRIRVNWFTSWL